MKGFSNRTSFSIGVCVVSAVLAGCAQSQTQSSVPSVMQSAARPIPAGSLSPSPFRVSRRPTHGWLSPQARTLGERLIYVADYGNGTIDIYPEKGFVQAPIGQITTGISGPYGLYVDKKHTLYVANSGNGTVTAYPAGSITPSVTYSRALSFPLYPIVDGKGNLFVGNAYGGGTIVEYLGGSNSTLRTLQTAGSEVDGMDFDRYGNLYVAYRGSLGGGIEVFAPGSSTGTTLGMTLNQPQGLLVDYDGNILAVETGGTNRIDLFPLGSKIPSLEIPIPNNSTPTQLTFKHSEAVFYVSTLGGLIYGSRYPFLTKPSLFEKDWDQQTIQGLALSDDQTF